MHNIGENYIANEDATKLSVMGFDYSRRPSACEYYRTYVPTRGLEAMEKAFCYIANGEEDKDMCVQAAISSDIVHMYAVDREALGSLVDVIGSMKPQADADGRLRVPPSTVWDIDDNNDYVHPYNPAFNHLGYRSYPSGKLMEPGDSVVTIVEDGTEKVMWDDKKTLGTKGVPFDIARNRATVASQMHMARSVQGVTVPSIALAKYFKQVQKCKNVHVFPNTIMMEDWHFPNLVPRTDGRVRILWQGGDSHAPDWFHLHGAVAEICKRYPHVTFVIWGGSCVTVAKSIPPENLEQIGWIGFDGYRLRRALVDCDINLAPLIDNKFNHCKSAIKWYEASLGPKPEATLAANVEPYSLEMVDGETGLLYNTPEEFVTKLSILIENADLRRKLGEGAREWVLANRTPQATIPPLHDFYQELRAMRRQEYYAQ